MKRPASVQAFSSRGRPSLASSSGSDGNAGHHDQEVITSTADGRFILSALPLAAVLVTNEGFRLLAPGTPDDEEEFQAAVAARIAVLRVVGRSVVGPIEAARDLSPSMTGSSSLGRRIGVLIQSHLHGPAGGLNQTFVRSDGSVASLSGRFAPLLPGWVLLKHSGVCSQQQ